MGLDWEAAYLENPEQKKKERHQKIFENFKESLNLGSERGIDWDITPDKNFRELLTILRVNEEGMPVIHTEDVESGNCTAWLIDSDKMVKKMEGEGFSGIPKAMIEKARNILDNKK